MKMEISSMKAEDFERLELEGDWKIEKNPDGTITLSTDKPGSVKFA